MSSRSSSRRKEEPVSKGKKKHVAVVSDDSGDEAETEEETEIVSLSGEDDSSDEVIAPKKSRACSYNKSAFSMPDDISKLMNRVLCTACGKQLNPMNQGAVRKHPWLKVVTCRKCYKFLKSGPFTRDSEGTDEQCRWCGDGGRLYGCDYCHNCFCRSCIKRNMGRSEAADMENEDTKSKWKCYMCKPKKIRALAENCSKILDYIKAEEDKEKKRGERALQREKEKAQAAKEKRNAVQNGKEKGDGQKDRQASLPLPVPKAKTSLDEKRDIEQPRSLLTAPKPIAPKSNPDCIIISDSPDPSKGFKQATVKIHKPLYNSKPGDGVKQISKFENGVTQVVVGPKPKMPISMPYKDNTKLDALVPGRQALYGALTTSQSLVSNVSIFNSTPVTSLSRQGTSLLSGGGLKGTAQQPKANDIRALKEQIVPFNVETLTEKMTTVSQAFNLMLSSVKTDLAIAKLSSANVFQSRNAAAFTVKTGFDTFFNNIRDLFNVQIVMNSPIVNDSGNPINIDDDNDVKTDVKTEPGLSNGGSSENIKNVKPEVKKDKPESIKDEAKKEIEEVVKEKETVKIEEKVADSKADEMEVEVGGNTDSDNSVPEESMDISGSNEDNNLDRDVDDAESDRDEDNDESDTDDGKDVEKSSNKKEKIKDDKKDTDKDKKKIMEKIEKKSSEKECNDKKSSSEKECKDKKSSEKKDLKDSDKGEKKTVESSTEKLDKNGSENDAKTSEKDEIEKKKSKSSLSMKLKGNSEKEVVKESRAKSRKPSESNQSDSEDKIVESGTNVKTAVDLDLLKELADEINDSNDKDDSSDESVIRRSSRRGKAQANYDKDDSSDESVIRRSSRRGKAQANYKEKSSSEDVSETSDSNVGKSSRNKSSSKNQEKIDKDDQKQSSSKSNKSKSSTNDTSEDAKGKKSRKEKIGRKDESSQDEEIDEPIGDEECSKKKSSRSKSKDTDEPNLKKKNSKSNIKKESKEDSLSEDMDEKEEEEEEEKTRKGSGSKSSRSKSKETDESDVKGKEIKSKSKKESKEDSLSEDMDEKEEEEVDEKTRKGPGSKSSRSKSKDTNESELKGKKSKINKKEFKEDFLSEDMDEKEEDVDEKTRKGSGSKSSRSKSKDTDEPDLKKKDSKSKDKKESKEDSLSEDMDEKEEDKDEKTIKGSGSKSSRSKSKDTDESDLKKKDSKSKDKKESKEDSLSEDMDEKEEEDVDEKTRKGSGSKSSSADKKDSKKTLKESKIEQEDSGEEEDEEISSDSDSSIASEEFGKRKKKRKSRANREESEEKPRNSKGNKKQKETSKSGRASRAKSVKNDKTAEEEGHSDSSNFDADLEKEIKQLSKDTKLSRTTRSGASKPSEKDPKTKAGKNKSEKSIKDGTQKDGKDKSIEDFEDLSSDDDDDDKEGEEEGEAEEEEEEEEEVEDEDDLSPAQLRKLRAAQKEEKESDYEDMDASDESDDPEISFPKLETPKKGKKKGTKEEESEDSDFVTPKKKKRKLRSELLDAKVSDSDSDAEPKKKKKRGRKRKKEEDEDEEPDPEDEVYSDDGKKKKGKRKRIRKIASSSDEEKEKEEGEEGGSDDDGLEDTPGGAHKRRKIRKVMANKKLKDSTKEARKAEDERRKRIEERQKEFNAFIEVEGGESEDEVAEGTERETAEDGENSIAKILGTAKKVPVTTRCVLDMEKDTKKVLIEIDRTLVRKLKPHQVEAVRFMYNCLVESVERMKKEEGAGCILAHCMGLGKTLSVISFIHTMLSNVKLTKMTKCLVVCPLNTVLNWVNEFEIWLDDVPYEVDVYEMSKVKQNTERAQMLREWHEGGSGVMILGYDMYRNLVQGSHCKNKRLKATFFECLADPGPDLVVCDEGHILKNDSTSLSKSMMKIKTKRRVVLTGTPLQNNLGEYHCMVNFVKENLLGTRKEFGNRFVNPITNGQCTDSSQADVKLMKRRAHILHEMLAGCVQRKDYSALTKFLPPKFEYVVSVRMGTLQCKLYERYLQEAGVVQNEEVQGKGGRLFRDYQALMRIWTHPWVLKLDEIRQENKRTYDSEDSFIDDSESEQEDSFISASTTSESESEFKSKKKKSKGKGKKKKKGSGSSSDDDVKIVNEDEVVKKWTSKRRGNEEGAGSSWMQDMGYSVGPKEVSTEWWAEYVKEEDEFKIELSGKLTLMFEILKMCEDIGDKVLVFSQSLLSLDIIEDFLRYIDESNQKPPEGTEGEENKEKKEDTETTTNGVTDEKNGGEGKKEDKKEEDKKNRYSEYGKSWTLGADYFRMDGSTNSQQRKASQDSFNDPENYRARLFLISTKAGSLGINLVSANRVIIFDASWNPSHDIQSIFRVYRFGQVKPVYVYRFLAQGTMEEKIYERQVTKQSLSQRVVDEHQIERHFNSNDLQELYKFQPDRLDDPNRKERPLPMLPKDHMLAELMGSQKDWIVTFHEHDSLLENIVEQELSEEEKKAAWEDYESEKKGLNTALPYNNMMMMNAAQRMNNAMEFQNLVLQGQANLGQEAVLQIVQDLKTRFPTLPPEVFGQRVQAVLRQVLTQRIMQQSDYQRRQVHQMDMQKMAELNRLNQIKQQIQQQQALINNQQRGMGLQSYAANSLLGVQALPMSGFYPNVLNQNRPGATGSGHPPPAHSSSSSLLQKPNNKEK